MIATQGIAWLFGDLATATASAACASNPVRTCMGGGNAPTNTVNIQYTSLITAGTSVDFGDITGARAELAGFSNANGGLG